eukprot:gene6625-7700_t
MVYVFLNAIGLWSCKLIIYSPDDKLDNYFAMLQTIKRQVNLSADTKYLLDTVGVAFVHPRGSNQTERLKEAYNLDMHVLINKFDNDVKDIETFNKMTPAGAERRKKLIRMMPLEAHMFAVDMLTCGGESFMNLAIYIRIMTAFGNHLNSDMAVKIVKALNQKYPDQPFRYYIAHSLLRHHMSKIDDKIPKQEADAAKVAGAKFFAEENFLEAALHYSVAIDLGGPTHALYSNQSISWYRCGKYQDALDAGRDCVKLKPDWPRGYHRIGVALEALGRYQEANDTITKGLRYDANNRELIKALESIKEKIIINLDFDTSGDELLRSAMENLHT